MNQRKQLPLCIDLTPGSESESAQAVDVQIAELGADTVPAKQWVREAPIKPASAPTSLRSGTVTRAWFDDAQPPAVGQSAFAIQRK